MNVRLYDGTVRCDGCMDASSYESTTDDPCTYCGARPVMIPVILSDPETGETIPAMQPGRDVEHALYCLEEVTSTPGELWCGWEYVALV